MQSPSNLIFLVLLGVWAAYFVQYWIRRRDHLSTARSVEQFSEAMRVLERRTAIPRTDLSDPAPRSWAVHPARSTRPQVVVKRAVPVDPASPLVARTVTQRVDAGAARPAAAPSAFAASGRPAARPARPATPAPVRVTPSRRARASVLLLAFLGSLVAGGLAGLNVLQPWVPAIPVLLLVASFAWVRAGVRAEHAARAARRRRAVEESRRRAAAAPAPVRPARPVRPAPARDTTVEREPAAVAASPVTPASPSVDQAAPAASTPTVASSATPAAGDPLEVALAIPGSDEPVVAATAAPVAPKATTAPLPQPEPVLEYVHLVDEDDIPLTWEPVPVPRPTYTMKAKAERPEVAPAETTPEPASTQPVRGREDELAERRAAGA